EPFDGIETDELLSLTGSLEQVSSHVFAPAIVEAARARGLSLVLPTDVHEEAGAGIGGVVGGRKVRIGRADWTHDGAATPQIRAVSRRTAVEGSSAVFVSVDGAPA